STAIPRRSSRCRAWPLKRTSPDFCSSPRSTWSKAGPVKGCGAGRTGRAAGAPAMPGGSSAGLRLIGSAAMGLGHARDAAGGHVLGAHSDQDVAVVDGDGGRRARAGRAVLAGEADLV